jgi:hypothetical protein
VSPYDYELDQGLVLGVGALDEMRLVIEATRERDDAIRSRTAAELAAVELAWRLADERRSCSSAAPSVWAGCSSTPSRRSAVARERHRPRPART